MTSIARERFGRRPLLASLAAFCGSGCASTNESTGYPYQVVVNLTGSQQAFRNREFFVNGVVLPAGTGQPLGSWFASTSLCTGDRAQFLTKTFELVVREFGRKLFATSVPRGGCTAGILEAQTDARAAWMEMDSLFVLDSGEVVTDPALDANVTMKCYEGGQHCVIGPWSPL